MSQRKPLVVIGTLGSNLDYGRGADRWARWRPSVDLCRQDDLIVDRFELIGRIDLRLELDGLDGRTLEP